MQVLMLFARRDYAKRKFLEDAERLKDVATVNRSDMQILTAGIEYRYRGGIDARRIRGLKPDKIYLHNASGLTTELVEELQYKAQVQRVPVINV